MRYLIIVFTLVYSSLSAGQIILTNDNGSSTTYTAIIASSNVVGAVANATLAASASAVAAANITSGNLPTTVLFTNSGWGADGFLSRPLTNNVSTNGAAINTGTTTDVTNFVAFAGYNFSGSALTGNMTNAIAGTYKVEFSLDLQFGMEERILIFTNGTSTGGGSSGFIGANASSGTVIGRDIYGFWVGYLPASTGISTRCMTNNTTTFTSGFIHAQFIHP